MSLLFRRPLLSIEDTAACKKILMDSQSYLHEFAIGNPEQWMIFFKKHIGKTTEKKSKPTIAKTPRVKEFKPPWTAFCRQYSLNLWSNRASRSSMLPRLLNMWNVSSHRTEPSILWSSPRCLECIQSTATLYGDKVFHNGQKFFHKVFPGVGQPSGGKGATTRHRFKSFKVISQ